jgi:hypothetical protein
VSTAIDASWGIWTGEAAACADLTVERYDQNNGIRNGYRYGFRADDVPILSFEDPEDQLGIGGVLADPVMTVNAQGTAAPVAVNDNWDGSTATRAAFTAVGAFVLPLGSLDCAYVPPVPGLRAGGYTVQVSGTTSATGLVIAEIYDAAGAARTATTPRLINLSPLAQIDPGATLAVGFVIGGTAPCRVLVRAVGPTLGTAFGIGGVMADPGLVLFSNDTGLQIGANDDWGGGAALATAMSSVGAFALADPASLDAGLVVTLPPGAYSVRVSGKNGTGGTAIVEVYEAR